MRLPMATSTPFCLLAALGMTALSAALPARAQFLDEFDHTPIPRDPEALEGWSFFTGDGEATMDLRGDGAGHASILVDATRDRRGIWWALVKRRVSGPLDLERLARPGQELRIEARIRVSHAPRRVNLHLNTQRTTDFHSHLMEFDIPDTDRWHTISMTTRDFDAGPGDTVFGQLALMDWGYSRYRVDLDYVRVDVVDPAEAGPDLGEPLPYRPPIPDPGAFAHAATAAEAAVVDLGHPDVNLHDWGVEDDDGCERLLTVSGTQTVVLRFDLRPFAGHTVTRAGLLELTTHSVLRAPADLEEFGEVRVVEILGGDPGWREETVTLDGLRRGKALDQVFNGQMIIDVPVAEERGARTFVTISRPVLQRLVDGRTLGIALRPLGAIVASFLRGAETEGASAPRLLLDTSR
jgi:hypothetical protein